GSRFLVAGAGLGLWMWRVRRSRVPNAIEWRNSLLIGALLLGAGAGATAYAEQTVASGLIATFIAVEPALMAVGGLLFGYRLTRRQVIAIAVGSAGVLLLVRGSGFSASPVGLVAMTIATVGWSAG